MWTSECNNFLGITAHFIDHDWVQQEVLVGFLNCPGSATLAKSLPNYSWRLGRLRYHQLALHDYDRQWLKYHEDGK